MQRHPSGEIATCGAWPKLLQSPTAASRSESLLGFGSLSRTDAIRTTHERVQLCQDPQTEFALLRDSLGVSRVNHILRVHGHKILEEQSAAVYDEIGQRSLERLFPGLTEDSMTQATLSASQLRIGFKRARDIAAPSHLGALIAAKPRIRGMIRDAVLAGLLPEQLLETRLSEVIETAPSTYLSALDNGEQATARLFIQKAAQAAGESWQHTVSGQQGPGVAGPTNASSRHPGSASQDDDSDDMDFLVPSDTSQTLEGHAPLKGCLAASHKNRRPVSFSSLPQMAPPLGRLCAKCPDVA